MKKTNATFLFLLTIVSFTFNMSCGSSGENRDEQPIKSSASFLNKPWQLKELSVNPSIDWDLDGKNDTDIFKFIDECEMDDSFLLRNDNVVVRNFGKIKCDDEEAEQTETGTWTNDKTSNKIVLKEEGKDQELTVVESSKNQLVLTYKWSATSGKEHTMTAVYNIKQ